MCGIVGYVGPRNAAPILLEGLERLEYRGYDSAGIAVLQDGNLFMVKTAGKIRDLRTKLGTDADSATIGIAHTRWATHGVPNEINAHPHISSNGRICIAHNGIIENYRTLREFLKRSGYIFTSDTDTEVIAHLIEFELKACGDLEVAVRNALTKIEGTYGLAILSMDHPDRIIAARLGSPLVIGCGKDENLVASDVAALLRHTNQVIYLEDRQMVVITADEVRISTIEAQIVTPQLEEISVSLDEIEKGGYAHFMLKEIFEQPTTLRNAMLGRLDIEKATSRLNGLTLYSDSLSKVKRFIILACGTSWHAGLIGEYIIEDLARIPVEVEYASEFRYRNPVIEPGTVVIAISQSGETADTLAALREAKQRGADVIGVCNVVGSTIARETDAGVYIHAGPEIGVASTKAFTSQVTLLALIGLLTGRMRHLSAEYGLHFLDALKAIPDQVQDILKQNDSIHDIANKYYKTNNFLYLGRGYNFPVALEGALKLKEISYVHAEGYPAAEMKHGPIALIDENMPVVIVATDNTLQNKIVSNMEEVRARNGRIIAITTHEFRDIDRLAEDIITIPTTLPQLTPILSVIPLQLLAYHIAVLRGCNVDQPRNLAKSVTVE